VFSLLLTRSKGVNFLYRGVIIISVVTPPPKRSLLLKGLIFISYCIIGVSWNISGGVLCDMEEYFSEKKK
jgi:hypothetical protein